MTMAQGKQTCKILKEIRRQIAEANGIEFATSECRYRGDCLGTCPKCEAEVRYLEQQLRSRQRMGKTVVLAGISAGALALLIPNGVSAQIQDPDLSLPMREIAVHAVTDTFMVRGTVLGDDTLPDGTISQEPLIGATILNKNTAEDIVSDIDGKFALTACVGDTLDIRYIGYTLKKIIVTEDMKNTDITLLTDPVALSWITEDVVAGIAPAIKREEDHYLDLNVVDEKGNQIDSNDIYIEGSRINGDGGYYVSHEYVDDKHQCRIYWDIRMRDDTGNPLKEAILRIEAEGYDDPVTIKVKYPKNNAKKTIRFKHITK